MGPCPLQPSLSHEGEGLGGLGWPQDWPGEGPDLRGLWASLHGLRCERNVSSHVPTQPGKAPASPAQRVGDVARRVLSQKWQSPPSSSNCFYSSLHVQAILTLDNAKHEYLLSLRQKNDFHHVHPCQPPLLQKSTSCLQTIVSFSGLIGFFGWF